MIPTFQGTITVVFVAHSWFAYGLLEGFTRGKYSE